MDIFSKLTSYVANYRHSFAVYEFQLPVISIIHFYYLYNLVISQYNFSKTAQKNKKRRDAARKKREEDEAAGIYEESNGAAPPAASNNSYKVKEKQFFTRINFSLKGFFFCSCCIYSSFACVLFFLVVFPRPGFFLEKGLFFSGDLAGK